MKMFQAHSELNPMGLSEGFGAIIWLLNRSRIRGSDVTRRGSGAGIPALSEDLFEGHINGFPFRVLRAKTS
jgi:hypothetical protein